MSNARLLLICCILICGSFRGFAQTYDFVNYGVEQGLSQSNVTDILQDSRGYLWLGTYGGGLNRFDGLSFREYSLKDSLPGQIVSTLAESPNGDLWIGTTWGGVARYDGQRFERFDKQHGLTSNNVLSLLAMEKSIWIGTADAGIYEYVYATKVLHRLSMLPKVNAMHCDPSGTIWVGSGSKLYRFEKGKPIELKQPDWCSPKEMVTKITNDRSGLLLIGRSDGLLIYRQSTATFSENVITIQLRGECINDILLTKENKLYVGTLKGELIQLQFEAKRTLTYNEKNGLITKGIFSLFEDNTGHIWVGTNGNGVVRWRSEVFTYFETIPGLNSTDIFRIFEDSRNRIWTGSSTNGLFCYENGVSQPILNNGKRFERPVAIIETRDKHIWVGHRQGVTELINDRPVRELLPGKNVRALYQDSKGNLWIGTWEDGLYRYDGKTFQQYTKEQKELPQNYIHAILEDRKGNIWLGTGAGLVKYDGKQFITYESDLCNSYVGSLAEDTKGNIWLHTDQCINWFDGKKFHVISEKEGLTSNTTYFFSFDQYNRLWVGTNKGVDRVTLDEKNEVKSVFHYGVNNGFRGIECNSRAVCLDHTGSLWFGTIKGIIRYTPSLEKPDRTEPRTYLTDIRLFLEHTDWSHNGTGHSSWFNLPQTIKLPSDKNHLTFYFSGIQLGNPHNTLYQFMLSGFDSTWQPVTRVNQITYSNLPPGNYRFLVKAGNSEGVWNKNPARSGEIIIDSPPPPFWRTWWFFLLLALALAVALYYFLVVRARIIRRQREQLEAEIVLRTQEISKQNEEKSVLLKEIHHRVKNNLQVISSLLNLQAEGITDERVLTLFEDCRHRVNSMALIHEKMYQSHNLVNIDISSYIDELIHSLVDAYDTDKTVHLKSNVENLPFRIDTIVPLGLILNEIISNAMKYAFKGVDEGRILVSLQKIGENEYVLEAGDNGIGLPLTIHPLKANTLGMQLIMMLSEQLNGKVQLLRSEGTIYRITFKEEIKDRF